MCVHVYSVGYNPYEVLGVDSSLSSCSASSLSVCIPVSNVQENIVVPDLLFVVVRLPQNWVMFIIYILTKYSFSFILL